MPKGIYTKTEEHKRKIGEFRKNKKLSEETKKRISESHKGKPHPWSKGKPLSKEHKRKISENGSKFWQGKHLSKEIRKKMSESKKGRKLSVETKRKMSMSHSNPSEETRKKMSESLKGEKNPMYGKHPSEESIKKRLESMEGYRHSEETKRKISEKAKGHIVTFDTKKKIKEARARQILPIINTKIEVKIQNFLKQSGITFFTHQYIKEIEHGYQCDILIPSMNLIIECDGNYWHKYPIGKDIDHIRTKELIENGFKVLRLWEHEINRMTFDEFQNKLNNI